MVRKQMEVEIIPVKLGTKIDILETSHMEFYGLLILYNVTIECNFVRSVISFFITFS